MNDNFEDVINKNLKIERNTIPFKITQLKLTNYYWSSGDLDVGLPVSTSVELNCKYNFEKDMLDWYKKISHTYLSFKNCFEQTTDSYTEELINADDLISKLEENDLRNLKNNYFTDKTPVRFTHWEIAYNKYLKIVGTYDQELDVFKRFSELLDFKKIMENETKKVKDKLNQQ